MNAAQKAWFWMLDYAYSFSDELLALVQRPDPHRYLIPGPGGSADGRPVVLLPGIFETWIVLRHVADELQRLGHPVHVVPNLGRTTDTVDAVARQVSAYVRNHDLSNVVLVAHSKGGLIATYAMLRFDHDERIDGLIAINAPFRGSHWGRYLLLPSVRALAPDDLTVRFVGAPAAVDERIVSVYSTFDQNVLAGSRLPGARNVRVAVAGHTRILGSGKLLALLPQAISWLPPRSEPGLRGTSRH